MMVSQILQIVPSTLAGEGQGWGYVANISAG